MATSIIVGAGPGVGSAVAARFADAGFTVHLFSRSGRVPERLDGRPGVYGHAVDAADTATLRAAVDNAAGDGGLANLTYNAVAVADGDPLQLRLDELLATLQVNIVGPLAAAQAAAPHLAANAGSSFLLTGGGLALHPTAQTTALSLGKVGTRAVTDLLAQTLRPRGVHVASVVIAGAVQPDTHFAPDLIAAVFWELHQQPTDHWETERIYR